MRSRLSLLVAATLLALSPTALAQDGAPPPQAESSDEAGVAEAAADEPTAAPAAIAAAPLPVELRRDGGQRTALTGLPRIALVGYNFGAFVHSRVSASSGGSLFGGGMGARARMDFNLVGVDRATLERIATSAHADLVAQMQAAGIEVVPATEVFANGQHARFLADGGAYEAEPPGTENDLVVVGPEGVGAVTLNGMARTSIAGNAPVAIAQSTNAILLYPNLALDFVQTGGSGRRALGNRANVEGEPNVGVNPISVVQVHYSRGRFLDGWTTLNMREGVWADEEFASVAQTSENNNNASVVISAILGAGMQSSRRSGYDVVADPVAYEALALRAARGFNAAIVRQVLAARAD
ncbi:MAG: hypothetical protein R3C30_00900 [Hyphomonadaceae bacterium]